MTDNVIEFPKKQPPLITDGMSQAALEELSKIERMDELKSKRILERLTQAKYAIVSIANHDGSITVVGLGDNDFPKGISLCAASIDAMAKGWG